MTDSYLPEVPDAIEEAIELMERIRDEVDKSLVKTIKVAEKNSFWMFIWTTFSIIVGLWIVIVISNGSTIVDWIGSFYKACILIILVCAVLCWIMMSLIFARCRDAIDLDHIYRHLRTIYDQVFFVVERLKQNRQRISEIQYVALREQFLLAMHLKSDRHILRVMSIFGIQ
jgi:uncharacterized membrane protein YhdT